MVESIVTRCGTPLVKKGDEVKTGDVLVRGEIVLYNDAKEPTDSCYVQADADILVRTSIQYEIQYSADISVRYIRERKLHTTLSM